MQIISDAHEWFAAMDGTAVSTTHVRCNRCRITAPIVEMPTGGCIPHAESATSGFALLQMTELGHFPSQQGRFQPDAIASEHGGP